MSVTQYINLPKSIPFFGTTFKSLDDFNTKFDAVKLAVRVAKKNLVSMALMRPTDMCPDGNTLENVTELAEHYIEEYTDAVIEEAQYNMIKTIIDRWKEEKPDIEWKEFCPDPYEDLRNEINNRETTHGCDN